MSRQKEYFLVIDTETCNSVRQPIPYDIGYAICDRHGNIYERHSFIVAEVFDDMADVMQTAYYAKKIPMYLADIESGKRVKETLWNIRKQIKADMSAYNVHKVGAYNAGFDKKAMNNAIRYISKSWMRWFFPFGTEFFCIWHMACQTLLNTTGYIRFAEDNGLESGSGNLETSAEACYQFLTNCVTFEESHTALEDVEIEVAIMAKCFATHKAIDKSINGLCWRLPQQKRREIEDRKVARLLAKADAA